MPKYVIERVVPGASKMTPAELKTLSQRSCNVLNQLGPQIQWVQSYVTDNKSIASTSRRMRSWSRNTRGSADFRRITSLRLKPLSTRRLPRNTKEDSDAKEQSATAFLKGFLCAFA